MKVLIVYYSMYDHVHRMALVGKVGSVFTSSATQHGGQESTILSFHITLLHHGMVIAGLPYTFEDLMRIDEITGGSPLYL
ncbi:MAG: hypothetical protein QMD80_07690 [archaeon]|nr:hypothetical protein [archaeon]